MRGPGAPAGRVYIYYPSGVRSGGPEALHQLCDALIALDVPAFLVPLDRLHGDPVAAYSHYRCQYAESAPDEDDVVVVLPEIAMSRARAFRRARVAVWWLSVDFSELDEHRMAVARGERSLLGRVARVAHVAAPWRPERSARALRRLALRVSHCAQSQYAVSHLWARHGIVANPLSDYVRPGAGRATAGGPLRTPGSVAFNPAKGAVFVDAVRELVPEVTWRPVRGLAPDEVDELLTRTEVYLDLGHHPGKDRIPREAALAGCVVTVARRGAAAFPQDVPIQDALRIDTTTVAETARRAAGVLRMVLADPEPWRDGQSGYRQAIRAQESTFRREVERIFVMGELVAPLVARPS